MSIILIQIFCSDSFRYSVLGKLSPVAWVLALLQMFHPYPIASFLVIEEPLSIRSRHTKKILKLPLLTSIGGGFHLQGAEGEYCICYFFIAIARMPKMTTQKRSDILVHFRQLCSCSLAPLWVGQIEEDIVYPMVNGKRNRNWPGKIYPPNSCSH